MCCSLHLRPKDLQFKAPVHGETVLKQKSWQHLAKSSVATQVGCLGFGMAAFGADCTKLRPSFLWVPQAYSRVGSCGAGGSAVQTELAISVIAQYVLEVDQQKSLSTFNLNLFLRPSHL